MFVFEIQQCLYAFWSIRKHSYLDSSIIYFETTNRHFCFKNQTKSVWSQYEPILFHQFNFLTIIVSTLLTWCVFARLIKESIVCKLTLSSVRIWQYVCLVGWYVRRGGGFLLEDSGWWPWQKLFIRMFSQCPFTVCMTVPCKRSIIKIGPIVVIKYR